MKTTTLHRILNIGLHRNSPRLWIEGALLKAAGFKRGDKYRIIQTALDTFVIQPDERQAPESCPTIKQGIVSGRMRGEREILIIDCHSKLFTRGPIAVDVDTECQTLTVKSLI